MLTDKETPESPPPPTPPPKAAPRKALPALKAVKPTVGPSVKPRTWRQSVLLSFVELTKGRKTQKVELDENRRKSTPITTDAGGAQGSHEKRFKRFSMLDPRRHEFLSASAPLQRFRRLSTRFSVAGSGTEAPKEIEEARVEATSREEEERKDEDMKRENNMRSSEALDQESTVSITRPGSADEKEVLAEELSMEKHAEQRRRSRDRAFLAASLTRVQTLPSPIHSTPQSPSKIRRTSVQAPKPNITCNAADLQDTAPYALA